VFEADDHAVAGVIVNQRRPRALKIGRLGDTGRAFDSLALLR